MFERYTENARRIVFFSRYEASQFSSPSIEPEHLFLGLLRGNDALMNRFLPAGVTSSNLRDEIERMPRPPGRSSTSVDLPLSHDAKKVLAHAAEAATMLDCRHIGPEHILLGLLHVEETLVCRVLNGHGVDYDLARREVGLMPPEPAGLREQLHELVDHLDEPMLVKALEALRRLQSG